MKRKILSIICVLSIMLTFSLTAFAAGWNAPKVSLEATYNDSENTVTLKVIIGAFSDLGSFQIKVNYPDSKFTVAGAPTASDLLPDPYIDYESVPGKVTYLWSDTTSPSNASDTTLLTVVLNIKNGAEGQAEFSLSDMNFSDSTGEYEADTPARESVTNTLVNIPDSSSSSSSSSSEPSSSEPSSSEPSSSEPSSSSSSSDSSSSGSSSSGNSSSEGSSSDSSSSESSSSRPSSAAPSDDSSQPSSSEKPASSEPASSGGTTTSAPQSEPYTGEGRSPSFYLLAALFVFAAAIFAVLTKKTYRYLAGRNSK